MTASVYTKTATKGKTGNVYAFGRTADLDGQPIDAGGYYVFKLCENYAGHVRGGIAKTWRYIDRNLSHADAVALMNRRLGYKAFN